MQKIYIMHTSWILHLSRKPHPYLEQFFWCCQFVHCSNSDSYQASYSSRLIITLVELTVSGFLSQVYIFDVTRILISWREFSFCQSCFHWRFTWRDSIKIGFYSQQERNISKWRKYQWSWVFLNTYIPFSYSVSDNLMIHILLLL